MIMDYNKSIQREIDCAYKQGKLDCALGVKRIIIAIKEQMLNSPKTSEKDLDIIKVVESSISRLVEDNTIESFMSEGVFGGNEKWSVIEYLNNISQSENDAVFASSMQYVGDPMERMTSFRRWLIDKLSNNEKCDSYLEKWLKYLDPCNHIRAI